MDEAGADRAGAQTGRAPRTPFDEEAFAARLAELQETLARSQKVLETWLEKLPEQVGRDPDPLHVAPLAAETLAGMMAHPEALLAFQRRYWEGQLRLWQYLAARLQGDEPEPVARPPRGDRRFRHPAWSENPFFDYLKQSYLLLVDSWQEALAHLDDLPPKDRARAAFFLRQWLDALSPSNFPFTNPEVVEETIKSRGENLARGIRNFLADLERGRGELMIRMTDEKAFRLGENIAATPGKVVFRNELFELIQYAPMTETVHARPLLIYPPWINKYYILDLTPEKSFVRWCVERGITVFMVSWVNPDARHRDKGLEDYMLDGQIRALEVVRAITGGEKVTVIGYCVAGTLLAATLAWLAAKERAGEIESATFLTAQVDFSEAGELCLFVDEDQLESLNERMERQGYLDAQAMFSTFNMLRANDLIWSFYVNNYLLGREPPPFDLLYWNADSTNLPARLHREYLTWMYLENRLVKPGGITLAGVPIDLTRIRTPTFIQAAREDHIAPPRSVYKLTWHLKGSKRFVLAGSGHIAGVVNPPAAGKYQYWTRRPPYPKDFRRFLETAEERPGSWWPHWLDWLKRHLGREVPAREPGSPDFPPLADAPGEYVRVRAL
ncbi:MAG: class I poly(R)-hydroxyalkanoic acid synthase [Rhodothalassiaceae bacterium]|nr:MAG: class I poly(R)-hydroxyalkanoic acid synthase [Rhodothalassiaceae bacterium]